VNEPKQFEIAIRRRIPLVSNLIYAVLIFFLAILFILYLVMIPAKNTPGEMATAYYILVVPEPLKVLSIYSGFGLLIVVPLYFSARLHKPATLSFHPNHLLIEGKKIDLNIPIKKIDQVFCNDLYNLFRKPKYILQFAIRQKNRVTTTFRLKHYEEGYQILKELNELQNIKISFYEDDMIGDHQDE
jgi:hypothetical protein